jgi:hypothetical protein
MKSANDAPSNSKEALDDSQNHDMSGVTAGDGAS